MSSLEKLAAGLEVTPTQLITDPNTESTSLDEKLQRLELLSKYDQKLVDALLESFLKKHDCNRCRKLR